MRRSGLGLMMLLLAVLLLVAWLTIGNYKSLNGKDTESVDGEKTMEQVENTVDSVNEHYDEVDSIEKHYEDTESIGE